MVKPQEEGVEVVWQKEMVDKAEPKVKCVLEFFLVSEMFRLEHTPSHVRTAAAAARFPPFTVTDVERVRERMRERVHERERTWYSYFLRTQAAGAIRGVRGAFFSTRPCDGAMDEQQHLVNGDAYVCRARRDGTEYHPHPSRQRGLVAACMHSFVCRVVTCHDARHHASFPRNQLLRAV